MSRTYELFRAVRLLSGCSEVHATPSVQILDVYHLKSSFIVPVEDVESPRCTVGRHNRPSCIFCHFMGTRLQHALDLKRGVIHHVPPDPPIH